MFARLNGVGVTDRSLFCGSVVLCYCSRAHGIKFPVRGGQAAASSSNQGDGHPLGPELQQTGWWLNIMRTRWPGKGSQSGGLNYLAGTPVE